MGNAVPKKKPAAGAAGALVPVDPTDDVDVAIAAFLRGFAFTHSFTHPYVAERVGPLWVMRDAPRNRPGAYYRREE